MSYLSRRIRTASQAKILRVGELAAAAEAREREAWAEVLPPILPLDFDPCFFMFLPISWTWHHNTSHFNRGIAWVTWRKPKIPENPRQTWNASSWSGRSRRFFSNPLISWQWTCSLDMISTQLFWFVLSVWYSLGTCSICYCLRLPSGILVKPINASSFDSKLWFKQLHRWSIGREERALSSFSVLKSRKKRTLKKWRNWSVIVYTGSRGSFLCYQSSQGCNIPGHSRFHGFMNPAFNYCCSKVEFQGSTQDSYHGALNASVAFRI